MKKKKFFIFACVLAMMSLAACVGENDGYKVKTTSETKKVYSQNKQNSSYKTFEKNKKAPAVTNKPTAKPTVIPVKSYEASMDRPLDLAAEGIKYNDVKKCYDAVVSEKYREKFFEEMAKFSGSTVAECKVDFWETFIERYLDSESVSWELKGYEDVINDAEVDEIANIFIQSGIPVEKIKRVKLKKTTEEMGNTSYSNAEVIMYKSEGMWYLMSQIY